MSSTSWTTLAHLLRPQGRKGELLAELLTDFPDRFRDHPEVFLAKPDFDGPESAARAITITNHWLPVGKSAGRVVLHFAGIDSISQAEALEGLEVIIPTAARLPLEEDAAYIDDLLGCEVFNNGTVVGTVESVDFPTTPDGARRLPDAAPLLTLVSPNGDEILIPYVNAFLTSMDMDQKRIDMQLPEGLVDLNRTNPEPDEPQQDEAA